MAIHNIEETAENKAEALFAQPSYMTAEAEAGFSKRETEADAEDCADVHKYVWLLAIGRAMLLYTLPMINHVCMLRRRRKSLE